MNVDNLSKRVGSFFAIIAGICGAITALMGFIHIDGGAQMFPATFGPSILCIVFGWVNLFDNDEKEKVSQHIEDLTELQYILKNNTNLTKLEVQQALRKNMARMLKCFTLKSAHVPVTCECCPAVWEKDVYITGYTTDGCGVKSITFSINDKSYVFQRKVE